MGSLDGRHALVTGGGSGIGAAIALALAEAGARVTIVGRRQDALDATAAQSEHITSLAADVTDEAALAKAFADALGQQGPVSIVVANAGTAETASFTKTSREMFERMLAVNLTGTFLTLREGLRAMEGADWGRLVVIASVAGLKGFPYASAYAAAKHGTVGLVRSLAGEIAGSGITANSICPGFTESPLLDAAVANVVAKTGRSEADARTALAADNPMKRFITPAEVAAAVLYVCGPNSGSINGQSLSVSGGSTW